MGSYSCYFLDQQSFVAGGGELRAATDKEAREEAERLFIRQTDTLLLGFEVWQRERFVHRHIRSAAQVYGAPGERRTPRRDAR